MKKLLAFLTLALLFSACGTVRDCDGNRYRTVKINGMHWMAENLRTAHYADGSPIPKGDATTRDTTGAYYFDYGNSKDSVRKYGLLYTWAAAMRGADSASTHVQGLCPDGWHLPDDTEWTAMTQGCASGNYLYRIPVSSQNMRIIKRFVRPPRSGYFYRGAYAKVGEESFWWSSSLSDDGIALGRYIDGISYPCPYVCFGQVCNGYSVRCVKDGAKITTPKTKLKKRGKGNPQQLSQLDIITIPHDMDMIRSFYSFSEGTQVNTWFHSEKDGRIALNYCVAGLKPITTFYTPNYLQHYILIDHDNMIFHRAQDSTIYLINSHSDVKETIQMNLWDENGYEVDAFTSSWHQYVPVSADSGLLITSTGLVNLPSYHRYDMRLRLYSRPMFHVFSFKEGQFKPIQGMGVYPAVHRSKKTMHDNYYYISTMNRDTDVVAIYNFIDSIYVIHRDGTQEQHYFHSKYQKHAREDYDTLNTYNYSELSRTRMARTNYIGVVYDAFRNLYYVIVAKPMPYENKDGTRNSSDDQPWSMIVLNSDFQQIAEIDMPDCLSKYQMMVVPKGIALMDKLLSDDERTCYVILKYNEKDLYNTDIAAVRRSSRRAASRQ